MSILLAAASLLARIMHETPSRDRGDGRAAGQPQGLGPEAYFSQYAARSESRGRQASGCPKRGGAGGRVICETKRIRSHYLLLDVRQASRTLDATPLQGRASPYTINAATMRLCGADRPASRHPIAAGSRSRNVPPHRAYSSERGTATSVVAAGDSCIMRARPGAGYPPAAEWGHPPRLSPGT